MNNIQYSTRPNFLVNCILLLYIRIKYSSIIIRKIFIAKILTYMFCMPSSSLYAMQYAMCKVTYINTYIGQLCRS